MPNEPLYQECAMNALIQSVLDGGADGLRLAGVRDIKNAKKMTDKPIIGITKPEELPNNWLEKVYITPSTNDAKKIIDAGADIIAFDSTFRDRENKENVSMFISFIQAHKKLAMADISNIEEAITAKLLGADIVSTTLSGYTSYTYNEKKTTPDFELLERLVSTLECPIILEGRIWNPEEVKKAFEIGAHCVVIGSAVTRPQLIVKRFIGYNN